MTEDAKEDSSVTKVEPFVIDDLSTEVMLNIDSCLLCHLTTRHSLEILTVATKVKYHLPSVKE